jgi:hypothetical protein
MWEKVACFLLDVGIIASFPLADLRSMWGKYLFIPYSSLLLIYVGIIIPLCTGEK